MLKRLISWHYENKIDALRPKFLRMLKRDYEEWQKTLQKIEAGDEITTIVHSNSDRAVETLAVIQKRMDMDKKYIHLKGLFARDVIRRYMINSNYLKYMQTVIWLNQMSNAAVQAGQQMPNTDAFLILQEVEKSFDVLLMGMSLS